MPQNEGWAGDGAMDVSAPLRVTHETLLRLCDQAEPQAGGTGPATEEQRRNATALLEATHLFQKGETAKACGVMRDIRRDRIQTSLHRAFDTLTKRCRANGSAEGR